MTDEHRRLLAEWAAAGRGLPDAAKFAALAAGQAVAVAHVAAHERLRSAICWNVSDD